MYDNECRITLILKLRTMKKGKFELPHNVLETLSEEHMFALRGGNMFIDVKNNGKNCSAINAANSCDTVNNDKNCTSINRNQSCTAINDKNSCTIVTGPTAPPEPQQPYPGTLGPSTPSTGSTGNN